MYESEIYPKSIKEEIPGDILDQFIHMRAMVELRSLMHWTEHCTECAMPQCFKTCDLYVPRVDGKCNRFLNGIERIAPELTGNIEILKIVFKKWAVMESQGSAKLFPLSEIKKKERFDLKWTELTELAVAGFLKSVS